MKINEEKIEEEIYNKNNINNNEIIILDENNIVDKDLFLEIKSIHDYLDSKNKKDLNGVKNEELKGDENIIKENLSDESIYIKYLKDPEIIFKKKDIIKYSNNNLKFLFNKIDYDIDKGNNIIFPFINVCENLVKA
jgi:hypothetical protein